MFGGLFWFNVEVMRGLEEEGVVCGVRCKVRLEWFDDGRGKGWAHGDGVVGMIDKWVRVREWLVA